MHLLFAPPDLLSFLALFNRTSAFDSANHKETHIAIGWRDALELVRNTLEYTGLH